MADPMEIERAYPFSEGPGEFVTEEDWAEMTKGFQDNGVYGHPGTNELTVQPGTEPGTIQVNAGDAQVGGFHYRLTAPKILNTVANGGGSDRWDVVALDLDRTAKTITPVILTGTAVTEIGEDRVPLGLWRQPPASEITPDYWGEAVDARWFIGARVRPYLETAIPPARPGALIFNPEDPTPGSVYLGKLDASNNPYWAPWYPIASERMESFEVSNGTDQTTRSTSWVPGNPQVSSSFVAPPSGQIMVTVFAQLEAESPSSVACGFEIRNGPNASGTIFRAANSSDAASSQDKYWTGSSRRVLVSGLVPGQTYFIRTMHRTSNSSSTATVFFRSLLVEPVYTDVAPGTPPEGGIIPSDVVLTTGGSTIRIPDGDTTTQALNIKVPAGDRASAPDTFAFYYNNGSDAAPDWQRTGYFNEYGEFRVVPSSPVRVPVRIRLHRDQSGDALQVTDLNNIPKGGFHADGTVYAPNVGNAKVSAQATPPANPAVGDLWVDISQSPPVVNVRASTGWVPMTGGQPDPDPDPVFEAPEFVDVQTTEINWTSVTVPIPAGDTIVACLAWNTTEPLTAPTGWTKVDEIVRDSARAAVYTIKAADVNSADFTLTESAKFSVVSLGYESANVAVSARLPEDSVDAVHTAPEINVPFAPARLIRFYWDKASTTTSFTADDPNATVRGVELGTGGGATSVLATDQEITTAGVVPEATATANVASAQAGAFSVVITPPDAGWVGFTENFETGELDGKWANVSVVTTVDAAAAHTGSFGMRQVADGTTQGVASLSDSFLPDGYAYADISFWFRNVSHTSGNSGLVTVENRTGSDHFNMFINYDADSKLWWDLNNQDNAQGDLAPDQWNKFRAVVFFGDTTWTARVWINDVEQTAIATSGKTPSDVRAIHVGRFGNDVNTRDFDDIKLTLSNTDPAA